MNFYDDPYERPRTDLWAERPLLGGVDRGGLRTTVVPLVLSVHLRRDHSDGVVGSSRSPSYDVE